MSEAGSGMANDKTRPESETGRGWTPDLRNVLLVVITLILVGWALHALSVLLVPLVAAILISLAVMPVRDLVRRKVPSRLGWLGIVAAMAVILLILVAFVGGLWIAAQQLVSEVPSPRQLGGLVEGSSQMQGQPETLAENARQGAVEGTAQGEGGSEQPAGGAGEETDSAGSSDGLLGTGSVQDALRRLGDSALGAAGGIATTVLNSFVSVIAGIVLIFFFTLLLLSESHQWREKVDTIARTRTEWRLAASAEVIGSKVRRYLLLRALLGLVTAALYSLWLWFFGVGLVLVWAMLTFLMNFVPTIGSLVAGLLPVAYALLTQDWATALGVAAGIFVIEQVMGNYVDPKFEGRNVALSALVILVALVFWGWAWGIAGTLLAVPTTVALVVLGAHVPILRPWALLLTNQTDMEGLRETTRPQ